MVSKNSVDIKNLIEIFKLYNILFKVIRMVLTYF